MLSNMRIIGKLGPSRPAYGGRSSIFGISPTVEDCRASDAVAGGAAGLDGGTAEKVRGIVNHLMWL